MRNKNRILSKWWLLNVYSYIKFMAFIFENFKCKVQCKWEGIWNFCPQKNTCYFFGYITFIVVKCTINFDHRSIFECLIRRLSFQRSASIAITATVPTTQPAWMLSNMMMKCARGLYPSFTASPPYRARLLWIFSAERSFRRVRE